MYVCVGTHGRHETNEIRITLRCRALAAERSGEPLACHSGLAQPATQSLYTRELPGLFVRRAASELRSVQSAERTPLFGLRSRGACSRAPSLCGQWARPARAAAGSCSALCQGLEARAGEGDEEQEELRLSNVESGGATDQLCRF